ncbi:protein of unknown function [Streptantibioticus cattleyicolor NRRL 8057 = DSM 46488]|nr:protein of unknown function [Streptantibioticus cattleyicolor NRRL 8057 = DSM 46488]
MPGAEGSDLLAGLALLHAEHDGTVHDRVRQVADACQRGHGEGRERGRLVFRAGDPPGGAVALVSGVQQAPEVLLVTGLGAEDGVSLVHQQRRRVLADDPEDHRRRGVHRHHRPGHGLVEHVQDPGLAAPLGRPHHRQARRMLEGGLDMGGRHPQGDRGQCLAARQHHVPADRRVQVVQQRGSLVGRLAARTSAVPGPRSAVGDHGPRRFVGTVALTIGSGRAVLARNSGTGFGDRRTESLHPVPGFRSGGTGPQDADLRMLRAGEISVPDRNARRSIAAGGCSRGP